MDKQKSEVIYLVEITILGQFPHLSQFSESQSINWGRGKFLMNKDSVMVTSCEELSHLKRPWFWEGLGAGGEGDDRGWDGWMASLTRWAWVWVNFGSLWWTRRPGVLRFTGSQRAGHDWATELNWTEYHRKCTYECSLQSFWKMIMVLFSDNHTL